MSRAVYMCQDCETLWTPISGNRQPVQQRDDHERRRCPDCRKGWGDE